MIQARLAEAPSWVAMSSPIGGASPLDAFAAIEGAAVFWEKIRGEESFSGFGAADSRQVSRADQPFQLVDELSELSSRIIWLADSCSERPPGAWFGGFAFDQGRERTALWNGFPAAKWIMPELMIWRRGARSFATAFCRAASGLKEAEGVARVRLAAAEERLRRGSRRESHPQGGLRTASDQHAWGRLVRRALNSIEAGSLSKVVLARSIAVQSKWPIDPAVILGYLRESVPECTIFAVRGADDSVFLGATPEMLCRVDGRRLETEAIAGSAPKPGEPPLESSDKEAREHRAVVDGIEQALRPLCSFLQVDGSPGVIGLPHVRHLRTAIRGRLHPQVALSELVSALHPTPAVGGVPRDRALRFLAEHEDLDRGWYAGPIGWIGDSAAELAVAIRSALIRGSEANLFVGAGIVAGSTAHGEWLETEAKSLTLLEAIGGPVGIH
jgi:isochorismate synthase